MAKPASRNTRRSGGNSIFTGVLIGLTVGAVLAVGVALWITGSNPFSSATPPTAPSQPLPATPEAAPSFDFYKVLPSDTPSVLPPATAPAAAAARDYLQMLAGDFHAWYNAEKFLVEEAATKLARLSLADATRIAIVNGLALLGVSAPEKM